MEARLVVDFEDHVWTEYWSPAGARWVHPPAGTPPGLFAQVVAVPAGKTTVLKLETLRRWRSPEALLLPIAGAIAQFLCEDDFQYVKACEGSTCTLLFVDRTRGRARRWCSMAICGNRAKQAAHRNRRKQDE